MKKASSWLEEEVNNIGENLPSDEKLKEISTLAQYQLHLEKELEASIERTANLQKQLDELRDKQLSDLLLGYGISELKLSSGNKVTVKRNVFASIKEASKEGAYFWLEENGFGSLIKSFLTINAEKGEGDTLQPIIDLAEEIGIPVKKSSTIHHATLKAFCAEQLDKGVALPEDLFSIHVVNRTVIK